MHGATLKNAKVLGMFGASSTVRWCICSYWDRVVINVAYPQIWRRSSKGILEFLHCASDVSVTEVLCCSDRKFSVIIVNI